MFILVIKVIWMRNFWVEKGGWCLCVIFFILMKGVMFLFVEVVLGLMIGFVIFVVIIIFGILVFVLDNKNNCL